MNIKIVHIKNNIFSFGHIWKWNLKKYLGHLAKFSVRNLAVNIDSGFTLDPHVSSLVRCVCITSTTLLDLGQLSRILRLKSLFIPLFHPILITLTVCIQLNKTFLVKQQVVQNAATRLLTKSSRLSPAS